MIVRETPGSFLLITQHDHGLVSGVFARNLSAGITDGSLTDEVLDAIANHDRAWQEPDSEVLWNDENNRPYSFLDHPPDPKTSAYTALLNEMESDHPYTGLLCSTHYGSLVKGSDNPYEQRFADDERERRERIRAGMTGEDLSDFGRDFAVLQFSDDLSLFICLNEPGRNEHPWFRDGIGFMDGVFMPVWRDSATLTFEPYPFAGAFEAEVPYRVLDLDGREKTPGSYRVRVTP